MLEPSLDSCISTGAYNPVNEISLKQRKVEFIFSAVVSIVKQYGEGKTGFAFKQ